MKSDKNKTGVNVKATSENSALYIEVFENFQSKCLCANHSSYY